MIFNRIPSWPVIAFGLLACALPAHAVQFRLLGWAAQDLNLQFDANRKANETYISTDTFSPVYEFKGEGPIIFYKRVEHEGVVRKQIACTVVIPPGMEQGLLLLIPGDDSLAVDRKVLPDSQGFVSETAPLIYDYVWFDDSLAARPAGTIEFRNLSRVPIAFQIEQHQLVLAPQGKTQVPLTPGAKRMAFRAAAQIDGKWKVFTSNPLPTRGPERMIVLLRDTVAAGNGTSSGHAPGITMIPLYDWPAPPKSAAADLVSANP
ncbi:MAG: hypothetical protein ACAH89_03600 [Rariglobus sp.]|nr:hypothetical protein [Rariglobus sp.]